MPPTYFFEKKPLINFQDKIKKHLKIALFLDFDGTLVPIQKDPAQCFLSEKMKRHLKLLSSFPNCWVSILSGRMLSDVRKRVGIQKIYYAGNHGLDISGPGIRYVYPTAVSTKPLIRRVSRIIEKEIVSIKGAWIEDKKYTVTLHFRSVKKSDVPIVKKIFYNIVAEFLNKKLLAVVKGKKILELVPAISWNKGMALRYILERLGDKHLPIYIGDDITDEDAFKSIRNKGITVRVGRSRKTLAGYYLKRQSEVSEFLHRIIIGLRERDICPLSASPFY